MQRDVQLSTAQQEDKKQPYEKPQLGMVRLFADQVLNDCLLAGDTCAPDPNYI